MAEKLIPFDTAADLTDEEAIAIFMTDALETNDAGYITHALGVVVRTRETTEIAKEAGLSREQLNSLLSESGNITLQNTWAITKALGLALATKVRLSN